MSFTHEQDSKSKYSIQVIRHKMYLGTRNSFDYEVSFPHVQHLLMDTRRTDLIAHLQQNSKET